jgi:acetylglutamate kinase
MRVTEPESVIEEILSRTTAPDLHHLERLIGRVVVVKYGGAAMVTPEAATTFARDLVLLHQAGVHTLVVHGGGPALTETMGRMGLDTTFVDGHRVTSAEAAEIAEMVLSGRVNKKVVSLLQRAGGRAVGLSGTDGGLVSVGRHLPNGTDVGFVGKVDNVDTALPTLLLANGYIPVVSSTAADSDGQPHYINADVMTGAMAAAMSAESAIVLTDVAGVIVDDKTRSSLTATETTRLLDTGAAAGGMRPKLEAALVALAAGVPKIHLVDGRDPHALLDTILLGDGPGTVIVPENGMAP